MDIIFGGKFNCKFRLPEGDQTKSLTKQQLHLQLIAKQEAANTKLHQHVIYGDNAHK